MKRGWAVKGIALVLVALGVFALVLSRGAPARAQATRAAAATCLEDETSGVAFRSFARVNPGLSRLSREEQVEAYIGRGNVEWARIKVDLMMLGVGDLAGVRLPEDAIVDDDSELAELARAYRLPDDNPLPLIRDFLAAQRALRVRDYEGAISQARAALDRGGALWGHDNSGLTLGYATLAEALLREGQTSEAISLARRGRAIIALDRRRAMALAAFKVALLTIEAEALELVVTRYEAEGVDDPSVSVAQLRLQAGQLRAEAAAERRARGLPLLSPYFNFFAVIPGLQPFAAWAQDEGNYALPIAGIYVNAATALAATTPSVALPPVPIAQARNAEQLASRGGICARSAANALRAGDLRTALASSRQFIGLATERNLVMLVETIANDPDDQAQDALSEAWEAGMDSLYGAEEDENAASSAATDVAMFAFAQGMDADLAAGIERSITPRLGLVVARAALREADPEVRRPAEALIRRYQSDLSTALVHLRTALVVAFRQPEPRDITAMTNASRWLKGNGGARLRLLARDLVAMDAADDIEADSVRPFLDYGLLLGPAVFDSIGWASAHAQGDNAQAQRLEIEVFRQLRTFLATVDPRAIQRISVALARLEGGAGTPGERSMRLLPPVVEGLLGPGTADDGGGETETAGQDISARVFMFSTMVPLAARQGLWSEIVEVGDPVMREVETALADGDFDLSDIQDEALTTGPLFELAAGPAGHYFYALTQVGRTADAIRFFDLVLPAVREAEAAEDENVRAQIAALLPDLVLQSAFYAYQRSGRIDEAVLVARVRARKAQLRFGLTGSLAPADVIGGLALGADREIDRAPFALLLEIADRSRSSPHYWDDVLMALDSSKRSPAAEALLLRSFAMAAGPEAMAAYQAYQQAAAQRESAGSVGGFLNTRFGGGGGEGQDHAAAEFEARRVLAEHIRAAYPAESTLLPTEMRMTELQRSLRPGELVVANMVVGDRIAILTVSEQFGPALTWSPILYSQLVGERGRGPLHDVRTVFRLPETYDRGRLPEPTDALERIHHALIEPISGQVAAARHIIWSPDAAFADLPVAAFRSSRPLATPEGPETDYLGLAHSITVVPSLSGLARSRALAPAAPAPNRSSVAIGDIPFGTGPFAGLRPTEDAGATIGDFVSATGGRAFNGTQASFASLESLGAARMRFLLVYSHGIGNLSPNGPGIYFMPTLTRPHSLIRPADIMSLRASPDYVLLAACSTGTAGRGGSEPFGGVVRSFLALGARGVLAAQRGVDERSTSRMVTALIQRMVRQGEPPAEALRRAQQELAGQPGFTSPLLWAQLLWVGDGAG